jgi:hypothetical protein
VCSATRPSECAIVFREGGRAQSEAAHYAQAGGAAWGAMAEVGLHGVTSEELSPGGVGGGAGLVSADLVYNAPADAAGENAAEGGLCAVWDEAHEAALGEVVDCVCMCLMRGCC